MILRLKVTCRFEWAPSLVDRTATRLHSARLSSTNTPPLCPFWISQELGVRRCQDGDCRELPTELNNGSSETYGWRHRDYVHILYSLWMLAANSANNGNYADRAHIVNLGGEELDGGRYAFWPCHRSYHHISFNNRWLATSIEQPQPLSVS